MYHECRLIHADLSEYNILYYNKTLYIIDVSQSVEHDHPHALAFLMKDCINITDFFSKKGVATMLTKELFDFITDLNINEKNIDSYLEKIQEKIKNRGPLLPEEIVNQEVFKNSYIPRTLNDIQHAERDINKAKAGKTEDLFYSTVMGLKPDLSGAETTPTLLKKETSNPLSQLSKKNSADQQPLNLPLAISSSSSEDSSEEEKENNEDEVEKEEEGDSSSEEGSSSEESSSSEEEILSCNLAIEKMPKKERKKLIKQLNRERRQHKIPKHLKKKKKSSAESKIKKNASKH